MNRLVMKRPHELVPFLTDAQIERETDDLLAEYAAKHGEISQPPIPVDEIIELYLGLDFDFFDLRSMFRIPDVLGALWVEERRIGVDRSLDPACYPRLEGRYNFTLGHEVGHWRLHRHLYQPNTRQGELYGQTGRATYVCRDGATERVEIQANIFASCLLMPRRLLKAVWHELHEGSAPLTLDRLRERQEVIMPAILLRRGSLNCDQRSIDNALLEWASRPLARRFKVSPEAMRIRLETIGLLQRDQEAGLFS